MHEQQSIENLVNYAQTCLHFTGFLPSQGTAWEENSFNGLHQIPITVLDFTNKIIKYNII
jgi:hypothetical protein